MRSAIDLRGVWCFFLQRHLDSTAPQERLDTFFAAPSDRVSAWRTVSKRALNQARTKLRLSAFVATNRMWASVTLRASPPPPHPRRAQFHRQTLRTHTRTRYLDKTQTLVKTARAHVIEQHVKQHFAARLRLEHPGFKSIGE
jgi:hypothetical protein